MKRVFLFLFITLPFHAFAQLTLDECQRAARENYPLSRRSGLIARAESYGLSRAARGWLPSVNLQAEAAVQSDITTMPFDKDKFKAFGVDVPTLDKDRYNVAVTLTQPLYDGGAVKAHKQATRSEAAVADGELETGLYALRSRVNQLYFGLLLIDEQIALNALFQENIRTNAARMESLVEGGLKSATDLQLLQVELLKAEQTEKDYRASRTAYLRMLSLLCGLDIGPNDSLVRPAAPAAVSAEALDGRFRPEAALFDSRLARLSSNEAVYKSELRPRLSLFLQGGYGRPGLNMLKPDFEPYGIAGLRLSWNISALYNRKDRLASFRNEADLIRSDRDLFLFNTRIEAESGIGETARYRALLADDDRIIELRSRIRLATEAAVKGGTATTTELVTRLNDEQQARLGRSLHDLQLLMAQYQLNTVTNR